MFIYEEIFRDFKKKKVQYVVVGGMALNLHGSMRNTADLDILVEMSDANLKKVISILKRRGYHVRQPIDPIRIADGKTRRHWIRQKHLRALNFYLDQDFKEVDLIIESPIHFKKAKAEMLRLRVGKLFIPVISIDHLILMKQKAGREVDRLDIADLKKIKKIRSRQ